MTVTSELAEAKLTETTKPVASVRFDWAMIVLCVWFQFGLYLDGWAHRRFPELETFFTPWHAVLYSGFLSAGGLIVAALVRNRAKGHAWRRALPSGYELSFVGVLIFAAGGVADTVWHVVFGIEADLEALVSPTHLVLALGGALIVTGPLRSAWRRSELGGQSWFAQLPMILSLALLLSIFTFFTLYAHPLGRPWAASGNRPTTQFFSLQSADPLIRGGNPSSLSIGQALGMAGTLLQAALFMGVVLLGMRHCRWSFPLGSLTIILGVNATLMGFMRDQMILIPSAVLAGAMGDLLLRQLRPSPTRRAALRLFAFAAPAIYYLLHFLILMVTKGIWWSVHMWTGSIVLAGVVGLLLSYLVVPSKGPDDRPLPLL